MEEKTTHAILTDAAIRKDLKRRIVVYLPMQIALFFVFGICIMLPILISAVRDLAATAAGNDPNRVGAMTGNVIGILLTSAVFIFFLFPILRNLARLVRVGRGRYTVCAATLERVHEGTDRGCLIALFVLFVSFWFGLLMIAKEVLWFENDIRYAVTRRDGSSALLGKKGDRFYLVFVGKERRPTAIYNTAAYRADPAVPVRTIA